MDLRSFAKSHLPAPVNDALKLAKYNFDLWTFPKEIVSHRYGPHRLQMHIHDRVAKEWYDRDWELPPEAWGTQRWLNLPGITASVAEMVAALRKVAGDEVAKRVVYKADARIQAIVKTWPVNFRTPRALAMGFKPDEDIESVIRSSGFIRPRVAIEKILTSAITIGTGGAVGAEGPIVQIGAAIASGFGSLFRLARGQMPTIIGCGAAAGISAIFNSPMGGLLFALEVILQDFSMTSTKPKRTNGAVRFPTGSMPLAPDSQRTTMGRAPSSSILLPAPQGLTLRWR